MSLVRAGYAPALVENWSVPKINWRAGLLEQEKCNDALIFSLALNDPKRLLQFRAAERAAPAAEEWEPPSLARIKRRMNLNHAKS